MSQQIDISQLQGESSVISSVVSGLYRISGVALFAIIPSMLWLARLSLQSVFQFSEARYWVFHPVGKLLVILACALCFYHGLVSLYRSLRRPIYWLHTRETSLNITILVATMFFSGGVGYWIW